MKQLVAKPKAKALPKEPEQLELPFKKSE